MNLRQRQNFSISSTFQTTEDGTQIANELMEKLGVSPTDLIPGAYMDLIEVKETAL